MMQPLQQLGVALRALADSEYYLFTQSDLSSLFPQHNPATLAVLLSRAVHSGVLQRVCRGIYVYPDAYTNHGLLLYHAAARLRACEFNYISLESALSDAGVISQLPLNWITLMSSGRNRIVDCGTWGHIEFIHTRRAAAAVAPLLTWDTRCHLWRASVSLALQDMKYTRRNTDLIDWEVAHEFV